MVYHQIFIKYLPPVRHILIITHLCTRTKVTPYVAQLAPWEVDHDPQVHKIKSAR